MNKILQKYKNIPIPAKASLWFVICSVLQKGIAFFTTPFFTRLMSTDSYGVVVIYTSWLEIVTIFATFQLATGVFNKAMIKYEKDRDGYTSSSLFLASLITIICFLLYVLFSDFFNKIFSLETILVVMMFVEIFFTTAMSIWSIRNRFEYKYKSVIISTLLVAILGPLTSIILLFFSPEEYAVQNKIFGTLAIKVIVYAFLFFKIFKKGKKLVVKDYWKYSLAFNLPLIPHYLSQQVLTQADRIMISSYCGSSDAAIYGVAYQLSMAIFLVTIAIHNSFTPWSYENLKLKKYKEIGKVAVLFELGVGLVCFLFSLFAPEFIYILGGEEYMEAIWIVPPVTMSILFQTIYTFFGNIEFYFEKTKFVMIASIIVAIANVGLNAIFIPEFGFVAAGYTTLVCYILYSITHWTFMLHICKKENIPEIYNAKKIWGVSLLCITLSFLSTILYNYQVLRYSTIVVGVLVIVSVVYKNKQKLKTFLKKD